MSSAAQTIAGICEGGEAGKGGSRPGARVVDILGEGVDGDWTPSTRLQIIKVSQGFHALAVILFILPVYIYILFCGKISLYERHFFHAVLYEV